MAHCENHDEHDGLVDDEFITRMYGEERVVTCESCIQWKGIEVSLSVACRNVEDGTPLITTAKWQAREAQYHVRRLARGQTCAAAKMHNLKKMLELINRIRQSLECDNIVISPC